MEPFLPSMKGDPFQEALRKSIQRRLVRSSIKRADHTIAVSGFVKDYLTTSLRVPENKISQVHHGLAPRANGFSRRPALIPAGWDRGFLFTCGSIRPARGLEDAFEALLDLKTRNRDMRLVIAGGTSPGMTKYHEGLVRFLAARGLADRVCWAGTLSDEEMCWCYKRCFLFIMTSRVEACPNIALEALSSGAISIAANNPPLPEVFVDCASFYETGNGRSLAEAIIGRLSLSDRERRSLSERARERSMMFSWDTTADKTLEVLRRVLKRSKNSE
jgi:glycosyltransferase involved in cell wall biosynthesis